MSHPRHSERAARRTPGSTAGTVAAAVLAALAVLWAMPATAPATTVTVRDEVLYDDDGGDDLAYQAVDVVGGRGERNELRVTLTGDATTVVDGGARVTAEAPCQRVTDHAVRCPAGEVRSLRVDAGDGDDRVAVAGTAALIRLTGGTGDDVLTVGGSQAIIGGGDGDDFLRGGGGDDLLRGGAGADRLRGDRGDDLLRGDDPASGRSGDDLIGGGAGRDTVTYTGTRRALRIDLGRGVTTDAAGGRDSLRGVENADGGRRADRILGDRGSNVLEGFGGQDRIHGRRGRDTLNGVGCTDVAPDLSGYSFSECAQAPGRVLDVLRGGRGDDILHVGSPRSHGGPGEDVFAGSADTGRERLPRSCEWWRDDVDGGPDLSTRLRFEGEHLVVRVRDGVMRLRVREPRGAGRVLARGTVRTAPGEVVTGGLALTAAGRRVASAARGPVPVWVDHFGTASVVLAATG